MAWCSQHRCLSVQHVSSTAALFRTSAQQSGQPAAAPDTFTYNAADSPYNYNYNYNYIMRTEKVDLATAATYCNQKGGHVVWYKDQGEQSDVENYFASKTQLLLPYFYTYWIGATAAAAGSNKWPNFRWGAWHSSAMLLLAGCVVLKCIPVCLYYHPNTPAEILLLMPACCINTSGVLVPGMDCVRYVTHKRWMQVYLTGSARVCSCYLPTSHEGQG
jgi:hypothetical protein